MSLGLFFFILLIMRYTCILKSEHRGSDSEERTKNFYKANVRIS